VALLLKRRGITRVRPLEGGFEAWRASGFPLEPKLTRLASSATASEGSEVEGPVTGPRALP